MQIVTAMTSALPQEERPSSSIDDCESSSDSFLQLSQVWPFNSPVTLTKKLQGFIIEAKKVLVGEDASILEHCSVQWISF